MILIKKLEEKVQQRDSEIEDQKGIVSVEIVSNKSEDIRPNLRPLLIIGKSSALMRKTLWSLMKSHNSSRIEQDKSSKATIFGLPLSTPSGDKLKINDNEYDSTPEIHKALSSTGYTGRSMKKVRDILMMKNNKDDLGYTGNGDNSSKRKNFLLLDLHKIAEIEPRCVEDKNLMI